MHVPNYTKRIKEIGLNFFWLDENPSSVEHTSFNFSKFSVTKRLNCAMWLLAFLLIFSSFSMAICDKARFDNYRIYSITIETEKQLRILQEFESYHNELTFIEAPTMIGINAELLVPPHKFADISDFFQINRLKAEIKVNNLQRWVNNRNNLHCKIQIIKKTYQ